MITLVYPSGLSDLSMINYVSSLVGEEHVRGQVEQAATFGPSQERRTAVAPTASSTVVNAHVLGQVRAAP